MGNPEKNNVVLRNVRIVTFKTKAADGVNVVSIFFQ